MESAPLSVGDRVGRYEILDHIATGGMGSVYKARDTELDRVVALKLLSERMLERPTALERFRREAKAAAKLNHKHIVTLFEWGQADNRPYLAMEFVEGIDL